MLRVLAAILAGVCLACVSLMGQPPDLPQFDVASVKQDTSGEQPTNNWQRSPGRIDFQNSQVLQLLRAAYGDFSLRVEGAPGWTSSERYDLDVRFPADASGPTVNLMLRKLLVERFSLVARLEARQSPVYSLVLARSDRSLGPSLQVAPAPTPRGRPIRHRHASRSLPAWFLVPTAPRSRRPRMYLAHVTTEAQLAFSTRVALGRVALHSHSLRRPHAADSASVI